MTRGSHRGKFGKFRAMERNPDFLANRLELQAHLLITQTDNEEVKKYLEAFIKGFKEVKELL